jgi:hypothetical protein
MRVVVLLLLVASAACGAEPKQPFLANAPHPDNAAVAGGAAAAAAALTIVDPDAATRGKPEKPADTGEKKPIEVKENVPSAVFDRLDHTGSGSGSGSGSAEAAPPAKTKTKRKGPPPKIPLPSEAIRDPDR